MRLPLLFAALVVALRLGLFWAGVELSGFNFGFLLMGMTTLLAFFSGHFLLREEPQAPMPAIFKQGLRHTAFFALLCSALLFAFNRYVDHAAFQMKVNGIIQQAIASGVPEAEARERAGSFFTAESQALLTLVGLLALGAVNAMFFAVVHHKLLRRLR